MSVPLVERQRAARTRRQLVTRKFYLDGGVVVTVRSPDGAVRLQSTNRTLFLTTEPMGTMPGIMPDELPLRPPVGIPVDQPSWSNCDERGVGVLRGQADPVKALSGDLVAAAGATGAATPDVVSAAQFLARIEDQTIASEVIEGELEGEILSGGVS